MTHSQAIRAQLDADLEQVQARLHESLRDLDGPLGELVRPQLQFIHPLVRAGAVLISAYCLTHAPAQNVAPPRERTLALAAAVEMLYIALTLHKRLVQTASQASDFPARDNHAHEGRAAQESAPSAAEKTYLGGTILAGDYCFSRASQLAAQTEHPRVVALFAQTLQTLSEALLREEFKSPLPDVASAFDENRTLLLSAVEAALLLHDYPLPTDASSRAYALHARSGDESAIGAHAPPAPITDTTTDTATDSATAHTASAELLALAQRFAARIPSGAPAVGNGYHRSHTDADGNRQVAGPDNTPDISHLQLDVSRFAPYWGVLDAWRQTAGSD